MPSGNGVLIIGAGGLGCGAAFALAAAGGARIGVVDDDVVDASNLQRQILHNESSVGAPKVTSLARHLRARFPGVVVEPHQGRFAADTAATLGAGYDVWIDGSDNLATKFLANDAAVLAKKPLVHAAAVGTVGQLLTVPPGGRPCYRCLFEELPPPDADAPSCAEAGVLGPLPGALGALQALEALRFLAGTPPAFVGRMIRYDARAFAPRVARFGANPACTVCGPRATITTLDGLHGRAEGDCLLPSAAGG